MSLSHFILWCFPITLRRSRYAVFPFSFYLLPQVVIDNGVHDPTKVTSIRIARMAIAHPCFRNIRFFDEIFGLGGILIENWNAPLEVNITDSKCVNCPLRWGWLYVQNIGVSSPGSLHNINPTTVHLTNIEISENAKSTSLMRFINSNVYLHNG